MARDEAEREDLIAEATAMVDRMEFRTGPSMPATFIGFRKGGAASLFWTADEVYHFNAAGQLRRSYQRGELFKAESGHLVRLRRHRDESETALLRTSVEESEQTRHLQRLEGRIDAIGAAIQTEQLEILRFVLQSPNPSEKSAREQIGQWIEALPRPIRCAKRPHVS